MKTRYVVRLRGKHSALSDAASFKLMSRTKNSAGRRAAGSWLLLAGLMRAAGAGLQPEIDFFPSQVDAVIFRNWDIVPHERIASVLHCDISDVERAGERMGLSRVKPLTREEIRRNVEIVLRRNWGVVPRKQIEGLLGNTSAQTDDFLSKENMFSQK